MKKIMLVVLCFVVWGCSSAPAEETGSLEQDLTQVQETSEPCSLIDSGGWTLEDSDVGSWIHAVNDYSSPIDNDDYAYSPIDSSYLRYGMCTPTHYNSILSVVSVTLLIHCSSNSPAGSGGIGTLQLNYPGIPFYFTTHCTGPGEMTQTVVSSTTRTDGAPLKKTDFVGANVVFDHDNNGHSLEIDSIHMVVKAMENSAL